MKIGIYAIDCPDGYTYVGQTTNFYARFAWHRRDLNQQIHCNYRLQKCWNAYKDKSRFKFKILELCSIEELDNRERYHFDRYNKLHNIKR